MRNRRAAWSIAALLLLVAIVSFVATSDLILSLLPLFLSIAVATSVPPTPAPRPEWESPDAEEWRAFGRRSVQALHRFGLYGVANVVASELWSLVVRSRSPWSVGHDRSELILVLLLFGIEAMIERTLRKRSAALQANDPSSR